MVAGDEEHVHVSASEAGIQPALKAAAVTRPQGAEVPELHDQPDAVEARSLDDVHRPAERAMPVAGDHDPWSTRVDHGQGHACDRTGGLTGEVPAASSGRA